MTTTRTIAQFAPVLSDAGPEPSLIELVTRYYLVHDIPVEKAQAYARQYVAAIDKQVASDDMLNRYAAFVERVWGDDKLPPELQELIGNLGPDDDARLHMLADRFKRLRGDFLAATGLGGETGEVLEVLKKEMRDDKPRHDDAEEELGDQLYYLILQIIRRGYTPAQVIRRNRAKLSKKYGIPEGGDVQ